MGAAQNVNIADAQHRRRHDTPTVHQTACRDQGLIAVSQPGPTFASHKEAVIWADDHILVRASLAEGPCPDQHWLQSNAFTDVLIPDVTPTDPVDGFQSVVPGHHTVAARQFLDGTRAGLGRDKRTWSETRRSDLQSIKPIRGFWSCETGTDASSVQPSTQGQITRGASIPAANWQHSIPTLTGKPAKCVRHPHLPRHIPPSEVGKT